MRAFHQRFVICDLLTTPHLFCVIVCVTSLEHVPARASDSNYFLWHRSFQALFRFLWSTRSQDGQGASTPATLVCVLFEDTSLAMISPSAAWAQPWGLEFTIKIECGSRGNQLHAFEARVYRKNRVRSAGIRLLECRIESSERTHKNKHWSVWLGDSLSRLFGRWLAARRWFTLTCCASSVAVLLQMLVICLHTVATKVGENRSVQSNIMVSST